MPSFAELIDQDIITIPQFTLECDATLKHVPVAYKTWGKLNATKDNVMIICHAFTGSADVEDWCVSTQLLILFQTVIRIYQVGPNDGSRQSF